MEPHWSGNCFCMRLRTFYGDDVGTCLASDGLPMVCGGFENIGFIRSDVGSRVPLHAVSPKYVEPLHRIGRDTGLRSGFAADFGEGAWSRVMADVTAQNAA